MSVTFQLGQADARFILPESAKLGAIGSKENKIVQVIRKINLAITIDVGQRRVGEEEFKEIQVVEKVNLAVSVDVGEACRVTSSNIEIKSSNVLKCTNIFMGRDSPPPSRGSYRAAPLQFREC